MKKYGELLVSYFVYVLLMLVQGIIIFKTNYVAFLNTKISSQYFAWLIYQIQFPILAILFLLIIVKSFKLSLEIIGLKKDKLLKALLYGLIFSIPFVLKNLIENGSIRNVQRIFLPSKAIELLCKAIYYLVFIGFIEEIIFRGILTELINKVSNNAIINVITIAFMFGIIHLPFYILQKISLINCTIKIIIAMIMHVLFWFLREKCKGNIYGYILAHALIDFAGNIV
jgi:uncharacterized protein